MNATLPPSLPNQEELLSRVESFEKTVALCLCIVPALFSAQALFVACSCPVFAAMFADFGAKLPAPTRLILSTWQILALISVVVPVTAVIVARRKESRFAVKFATVAGIVMFVVAQCITGSMFLPIFQLGAVAGGLK